MLSRRLPPMAEPDANRPRFFYRTAPSVCFNAFATLTTGVFAFECALSSRRSSLVHRLRTVVLLFQQMHRSYLADRCVET
jgi:hypothetical protein